MKHKLLSLFALAGAMLASASVWAQDEPKWPDPVKPTTPLRASFNGDWVEPQAGNTYYIYNVGAAQFMGCGRDWGTRTITTTDSIVSPAGSTINHATDKNFALPFTIAKITDTDYFYIKPTKTDQANGNIHVTGLKDGNASWYDGGTDRAAHWQFIADEKEENGFLLHDALNEPYDPTVAIADSTVNFYRVLAVDGVEKASYTWTDAWYGANAEGKTYKATWKFVVATDDVAKAIRTWRVESQAPLDEAMKLYNAALAIYNARVALLATLKGADTLGISKADIEAASAVYLSESATEAEILAANTGLQLAIQLQGAELPADITGVLQNPDFEVPTANGVLPPGWDITITGQNCGQQNRTDTNVDTGLSITNFIEAWHPSALGNGVIAQTVYGLPAGVYRLECDASICHDPARGDGTDIVGAGLYIQAGVLRASTPIGTPRLGVAHFEVDFENDGGQALTFGLFAENTNANWLSADNFKLYYVGQLTESPHYKNLKNYLDEVELAYSADDTYCNATAKAALNSAIEEADDITTDATDAECDSAYNHLKRAYDAVTASVKVYQSLYEAIQTGGTYDYYADLTSKNGWDALSDAISDKKEDLETGYYTGAFSDEEVEEAVRGVLPMIRTWVSENIAAIQPGSDLTILLENADFEDGKYNAGWDAKDDEVQPDNNYGTLPGWTISSGNITQMNHVIETYHRKFDFNQTIPNMPAGVYDITVQGFVRHDGSATDQTIFYAGNLETQLMLRSDQWNETGFYLTDDQGDPCGGANKDQDITVNGTTVKVPNGMSGFYYWEKEENTEGATMDYIKWQPGDKYYTNHIKAYLLESGDLTIGMKSLGTTDWIIWDNFQITYLGDAGEIYAEMAEEKFNELTAVYENETNATYLTGKATEDYNTIAGVDYTGISSLAEFELYAAPCDSLIKYIKEGTELGSSLLALLADYESRYTYSEASLEEFESGIYTTMTNKLEGNEFADNDELKEAPEQLAKAWAECILKDADTSIFGNATDIIYSPKYTTYSDEPAATLAGWSLETAEGVTIGNYRAANSVAEAFNPSGEFSHYQKLVGMKAGFYHLTVDAFFRPGDAVVKSDRAAFAAISRAYMFGDGNKGRKTETIKNILDGAQSDEDPGYENETVYTWTDGSGEEYTEYAPNDVASAWGFFNEIYADAEPTPLEGEDVEQSVYRIALDVEVDENGELTIGISNEGLNGFVANDWICFSNWTLSYLGTEAPVGIAVVDAKTEKAPAVIYTIDGRQASRLQRGMNIVRNADGNVQKVLVK